MSGSPRHVGMSFLEKVQYDMLPLWVYHTALERKKHCLYREIVGRHA